jgi:integrase
MAGWTTEKPNGKWLARWRDADGKGRAKQFDTEREASDHAERMSSKLAREIATGRPGPNFEDMAAGVRFDDRSGRYLYPDGTPWNPSGPSRSMDPEFEFVTYLRRMVERDRSLRPSTKELYARNIRLHIDGTDLAQADIRAITPSMVEDWWAKLEIGVGALRNTYQLVAKAFNRAVVKGHIDVSPLKRAPEVKRPSGKRQEEYIPLTVAELETLADSAKLARDRLEILVMGYGALRAGEVGGLRKQDIAFDSCELKLRQQVARVTGVGQYIEELKTDAAKRTVTLPCSVTEELRTFLESNPPAEDGRVFHGANGAMRAHNAVNHGVQTAATRAGLPPVNAHRLRHTAVSLLIDKGANPRAIQRFVGHSDIKMTLGTYGHLFRHGGKELADIMESMRDEHRNGRES